MTPQDGKRGPKLNAIRTLIVY